MFTLLHLNTRRVGRIRDSYAKTVYKWLLATCLVCRLYLSPLSSICFSLLLSCCLISNFRVALSLTIQVRRGVQSFSDNEFHSYMNEISFSFEGMGTKTRFVKQIKGHTEMAYFFFTWRGRFARQLRYT